MLRNHITRISRTLWRNKTFSAINIFGLSIGMATCLLILLYVQQEMSYDRFNEKADRICRVFFRGSVQDEKLNEAHVMPPVAQALQSEYPEVEAATRLRQAGTPDIRYQDKSFRDNKVAFVDANFFQVFTLPFLQGDAKTALVEPNSMVISKMVAEKYFGQENPLGKVLQVESSNTPYIVRGVMEGVPQNAHFQFDIFCSIANVPEAASDSWMSSEFYTYLLLQKGQDVKKLEAKLPQVLDKYMGPQLQKAMGISFAEFRGQGNSLGLMLQPLTDIHLYSDFQHDLSPAGNIQYIYIFSAIALFMLLIACINFMNLSTAGAAKRSREVGIRKVLGSMKWELMQQFLLESSMLTGVALLVALGLVYTVLPFFNAFTDLQLSLSPMEQPWLLPGLLAVGLATGILAGSYPAFFLSSFQPVAVLKGKFSAGKKSLGLRSGLVVFQFFISTALIMCTLVVQQQLSYIQHKQLGYNKEQVLVLPNANALGNKQELFRQQLAQNPHVSSVSTSGYIPAGESYNNNFLVTPDESPLEMVKTLRYDVDENYLPTLGMKLLRGRNFSKEFSSDSSAIILNEAAAKALGWEKDALNRSLSQSNNDGVRHSYHVIGVVQDFHFKSLHEPIGPLVMVLGNQAGNLLVKVKPGDISGLLAQVKTQWNELEGSEPFAYSFLDERFNNTYKSEQKTGLLLGIFAGLTIFVACLGLFGLAMFMTEQRNKEIGIRKVLGASILGVTSLLVQDFLKLVLFAMLIAAPVAWYCMDKWLLEFAYRIDMQWWMFVLAGAMALGIAIFTVGFQSIKAALINPVEALRND